MITAAILAAVLAADATTLTIGSTAPPLTPEHWVKGIDVKTFEPGKVYVVEFWATWCGPCVASIPHLTEIQTANPDATIIGIAGSESQKKGQPDNRLTGLTTFVQKKGDAIGYRIAFDSDRSMSAAWMTPSGQQGIPCTFIVGKDGKIEWIGHPMTLDQPLAAVLAGTWDRAKAKSDLDAAQAAEAFYQTELPKLIQAAEETKDWKPVIARLDEVAAKSSNPSEAQMAKFQVLSQSGQFADMMTTAKQLLATNLSGSAFNQIAWVIATEVPDNVRDLEVALSAADKAVSATKGEDPSILDTQARVYWELANPTKALEIQTKAIALAEKQNLSGAIMDEMKTSLQLYKNGGDKN